MYFNKNVSVATKIAFPNIADKSIEKRVRKWFANRLKKSGWHKKQKSAADLKSVIDGMEPSAAPGASNASSNADNTDDTDDESSSTE